MVEIVVILDHFLLEPVNPPRGYIPVPFLYHFKYWSNIITIQTIYKVFIF